MTQYLVIAFDDAEDSYIVSDLDDLISQMYDGDEEGEMKFYRFHKVYKIEGNFKIDELN